MIPVLEVVDLQKSFGAVKAVRGISFSVAPGECYGLLGPNGAGKSTTLEMIEQIISPDAGKILFEGEKPGASFQEKLGIQFQKTALFPKLTAAECLNTYAKFYAQTRDVNELIEKFQLSDFLSRRHDKLSGGQRQRLLLAMALISRPKLILLDEPTTGLDPQSRRALWRAIEEIRKSGESVILTTHYMEEAEKLCDRIAIVDHGKIICEGPPKELIKEHLPGAVVEISKESGTSVSRLDKFASTLDANLFEIENSTQKLSIQTRDQKNLLKMMIDEDLDLNGVTIRQSNLEDLFIKLTGSKLRD